MQRKLMILPTNSSYVLFYSRPSPMGANLRRHTIRRVIATLRRHAAEDVCTTLYVGTYLEVKRGFMLTSSLMSIVDGSRVSRSSLLLFSPRCDRVTWMSREGTTKECTYVSYNEGEEEEEMRREYI
ncbi:uncharacterized protein LOC124431318 [Vespa crabro]|uniref:uncharacterized protein LOC124431318 n=1 Tax=Vespa crabro TaxID=7445 RepID=UPI001EFFB8FA|nr:uncharacterized protein LOC124431318 [Vespa crabro]